MLCCGEVVQYVGCVVVIGGEFGFECCVCCYGLKVEFFLQWMCGVD